MLSQPETPNKKKDPEPSSIHLILSSILNSDYTDPEAKKAREQIKKFCDDKLKTISESHYIVFLYSTKSISTYHLDYIYKGLQGNLDSDGKPLKPVLMILRSNGGSIEPAFKISKVCNHFSKGNFAVAIPRAAKSAATLIALGAAELHMGYLSEIGPIDPQIRGFPALGLQDSLRYIASLVKEYPQAAPLFAEYLSKTLSLNFFGWANRVSESAMQYGQKLLELNMDVTKIKSQDIPLIVKKLVMEYKDHGFVIDAEEASVILGSKIIKKNTDLFKIVDELYESLSILTFAIDYKWKRDFQIVGSTSKQDSIMFSPVDPEGA